MLLLNKEDKLKEYNCLFYSEILVDRKHYDTYQHMLHWYIFILLDILLFNKMVEVKECNSPIRNGYLVSIAQGHIYLLEHILRYYILYHMGIKYHCMGQLIHSIHQHMLHANGGNSQELYYMAEYKHNQ